ncbi:hypothetical protein ABPG77_001584 [Micractinium sp. CCAP 211/92]
MSGTATADGSLPAFRNTYWLLRHGRSHANEQDVIVSLPENGRDPRWGLSGVGQQQAAAAGRQLAAALAAEPGYAPEQLLVLASPFSRTLQTAECAGLALGLAPGDARLQVEDQLRERCFGAYELASCCNYEKVWERDAASTANRPPGQGGESVEDVAHRTAGLIARLEAQHHGKHIVLVSHGDALSILAAALMSTPLGSHRQHGLPNCGILRIPVAAEAAPAALALPVSCAQSP